MDDFIKILFRFLSIEKEEDFLGIYLMKEKVSNENFLIKFQAALLNHKLELQMKSDEFENGRGCPKFIELKKLFDLSNKYIDKENCMTINVEVI